MLIQIGEVDGAKRHFVDEEFPEGEQTKSKKKRTIMSRASDDLKKPEDELLEAICDDITSNLRSTTIDMETVT